MSPLPVVVVGGGLAGLAAAAHAQRSAPQRRVVLVEADGVLGGRCRQTPERDAAWQPPLDIGGEWIHGENTPLYRHLERLGVPVRLGFNLEKAGSVAPAAASAALSTVNGGGGALAAPVTHTLCYLGREQRAFSCDTDNESGDFQRVCAAVFGLAPADAATPRASLLEHAAARGLPWRLISLADALTAKTWGSTLDRIGARAMFESEQREDDYGADNYRPEPTYRPLVAHLAAQLRDVRLNTAVSAIDYSSPHAVRVSFKNGSPPIDAAQVIVAVPLSVLRDGDIAFEPPLPMRKREALSHFNFDAGLKVVIEFERQFWPDDHVLWICADSFAPQCWTDVRSKTSPRFIAFVTGDAATAAQRSLAAAGGDDAVLRDAFLSQLDAMYATPGCLTPARDARPRRHLVYDWTKNPFVRGTYASPGVDASVEDRHALADSIGGFRVHFAGEHTHDSAPCTLHAALESGLSAAQRIERAAL